MKLKKIFSRLKRKCIFALDGVSTKKYMKKYNKWLKGQGMDIQGNCKYISHTVFLDGSNYSKIHIGNNVVISVGCTILVHDCSIEAAFATINKQEKYNEAYVCKDVVIGNDSFIGANCTILCGTKIGNNCIVGAGSVLPGKTYPDNSVIVGNPGRIIGKTDEFAKRKLELNDFCRGFF